MEAQLWGPGEPHGCWGKCLSRVDTRATPEATPGGMVTLFLDSRCSKSPQRTSGITGGLAPVTWKTLAEEGQSR